MSEHYYKIFVLEKETLEDKTYYESFEFNDNSEVFTRRGVWDKDICKFKTGLGTFSYEEFRPLRKITSDKFDNFNVEIR